MVHFFGLPPDRPELGRKYRPDRWHPGPGGYGVLYRAGNRLQFDGSSGLPSIEHYGLGCSNKPEYHLEFIVEWG